MDVFIKSAAGILVALVLYIVLQKQGKDIGILLSITVCAIVGVAALHYLQPVIDLISELKNIGNLDSGMLRIVIRAVGIGLLAEISMLICTDAGNASMGKILQLLASAVVLWMSIPLFTKLIELIQEILGTI